MKERARQILERSIEVKRRFLKTGLNQLEMVVAKTIESLQKGGKVLLFGNGGSAADAQHLAAEFVNRFLYDRPALPAIALTTDSSVLTSISNDYAYEHIFSRQIAALGRPGDIAFGISTSGNSPNVIEGLKKAKEIGLLAIALSGGEGGKMKDIADFSLIVPSNETPRIQEVHITIGHLICELVEEALFPREKVHE